MKLKCMDCGQMFESPHSLWLHQVTAAMVNKKCWEVKRLGSEHWTEYDKELASVAKVKLD